jgi:ABC-type antimicrobial peptide transport system permease subunit
VLAAMKTVVASMGVQTALCLLNAQYEIRRGSLLNTVVWVVASCFTVPVFWCVLMNIIIPNSDDWWCKSSGRFSSATTGASVVSSVGVIVMVLWLGEGRFK